MKYILATLAIVMMTGCGAVKRLYVSVTGDASEYCHKGIVYLQLTSGAALAVDTEGKPLKCN